MIEKSDSQKYFLDTKKSRHIFCWLHIIFLIKKYTPNNVLQEPRQKNFSIEHHTILLDFF